MSILAQLVICLAIFAAGAAGGIKWHAGQDAIAENERIAARAEKERNDRKAIDVAATSHEKDKGAIRTEFLTITQTVEKVVHEPFYLPSELCLDADGLRALTAATGAKPAASQPQGTVSRPRPAE